MGAFSCLCLPLPKRTSDGGSELELRSACEKITGPIAAKEPDRAVSYTDLCGTSKGIAVSPFETALTIRGASAPRLSFQGMVPAPFLSPFDSVKSFPSFLSAASLPAGQAAASAPGPAAIRTSAISPLELVLGHFDLDRRDTANVHDLSNSQPPSPKTPHQGEPETKGEAVRNADCRPNHSAAARSSNPIRGHPRYRKLKRLHSRGLSKTLQGSQSTKPLTLLCKDEDMGQLAVVSFVQRGSPHMLACEADILNMRMCNAHPFIMHLHQAFVTKEFLAVVTEHGEGGLLSEYIPGHSAEAAGVGIREEVARSFFQQLVVAVDFCHSMGIPVRDLRPHNLLLLEPNDAPSLCSITSCGDSCIQPEGGLGLDGVPRLKLMLTQMQLASAECDDSAAVVSYCQADFAAPEVNAGASQCNPALADVWSCGVLLHCMLTGALPFHPRVRRGQTGTYNPNSPVQADRHRYMKVKGISAECRNLLAHMFRANPADRATMADIMGHPWFRKDCPQGMVDLNTELIIMIEEGLVEAFSSQGEAELRAMLERARQTRPPSKAPSLRSEGSVLSCFQLGNPGSGLPSRQSSGRLPKEGNAPAQQQTCSSAV